VFSATNFTKGDFLLQYAGEKLLRMEGEERMRKSSENKIFFYNYQGKDFW
jgi:hypothetical protein